MAGDDEPQAPPGVGPHELRELELMLAGTKPAAMFGEAVQFRDIIPEDDFAPYVASGRTLKREYYRDDKATGPGCSVRHQAVSRSRFPRAAFPVPATGPRRR